MKNLALLLPIISSAIIVVPLIAFGYMAFGCFGDKCVEMASGLLIPLAVIFSLIGSIFVLLVNYKTKKLKTYYILGGILPAFLILGTLWPIVTVVFGL